MRTPPLLLLILAPVLSSPSSAPAAASASTAQQPGIGHQCAFTQFVIKGNARGNDLDLRVERGHEPLRDRRPAQPALDA